MVLHNWLTLFRIFREQKRVAKAIMSSQEEAYWRLQRPPVSGQQDVLECARVSGGPEASQSLNHCL